MQCYPAFFSSLLLLRLLPLHTQKGPHSHSSILSFDCHLLCYSFFATLPLHIKQPRFLGLFISTKSWVDLHLALLLLVAELMYQKFIAVVKYLIPYATTGKVFVCDGVLV